MADFYDFPLRYLIWGLVREALPEGTGKESHEIGDKIADAIEAAPVQDTRYRSLKRSYKYLGRQYGDQSQRLGKAYGENAMLREQLRDFNEHGRRSTYRRLREAEARIKELEASR